LLTLGDQAVEVLIVGTLDAEIAAADVVDSLIVNHEAAVGVLESGVGGQDRVVRLDNGSGDLGSRVDAELQLALLAVVDGQSLHEQSPEPRSRSTAEGVENEEALKPSAVVGNATDLVKDLVDQFFADSIVTTRVIVGRILLASDHLLGVEERAIGAGANFVDDVGLEIAVDGTRDIFAIAYGEIVNFCQLLMRMYWRLTSLGEEGAEALVRVGGLALFGEESIRLRKQSVKSGQDGEVSVRTYLDAVLEAVELQGGPSQLQFSLGPKLRAVCFLRSILPPSRSWRSGNRPGRLERQLSVDGHVDGGYGQG
jgi:hypothetical protein